MKTEIPTKSNDELGKENESYDGTLMPTAKQRINSVLCGKKYPRDWQIREKYDFNKSTFGLKIPYEQLLIVKWVAFSLVLTIVTCGDTESVNKGEWENYE